MAKKVQIKVDASKLLGAFTYTVQGKSASKECLCIPKENFYQGKDGALYIDLIGYEDERRSYGRLYSLKQSLNRAEYEKLKQSGAQLPFCGDIKYLQPAAQAPSAAPPAAVSAPASASAYGSDDTDDLPF